MERREEVVRLLQILGLSGFAFAQPVLDVFGRSPETFIFRGAGRWEIVLFAALVALAPGLAVWMLGALAAPLGPAARHRTHVATVWVLASVVGIQVLKRTTPLLGVPLVLAGAAFGGAVALLFVRWRPARTWLTYASPAPLAFALVFLLLAPVSKLVLPAQARADGVGSPADPVPVVMLVFDELPLGSLLDAEGGINRALFPNYARLAGGSTWYRNYTVTENRSHFSIPTILAGRLARDRSTHPVAADHPDTLFSLLRHTHRVTAREWYTALCPPDVCTEEAEEPAETATLPGLLADAAGIWADLSLPGETTRDIEEQFDVGEQAAPPEGGVPDPAGEEGEDGKLRLGLFEGFLDSFRRDGRPIFSYLHTHPPHSPWVLFPSGTRYESLRRHTVRRARPTRWVDDEWPVVLSRSRHLLQVGFTDLLVGEMIRELEETGLYDEALVVVTSDHGVSFIRGGPLRAFTEANLHEVASVPLFVKAPGQREGRVDGRNLSAPDLLPTIADMLGTEVPWETDGSSALRPEVGRSRVKMITRHRDLPNFPWPDRTFSIDVETLERRLARDTFDPADRSSDPAMWPYLIGPRPDLVGRSLGELDVGPRTGDVHAVLRRPGDFTRVDLSEGVLPALVAGRVEAGPPGGALVAVTLNGRVAAVSPTFSAYGGGGFEALIPEDLFREGRNELELFLVEGEVLRPLPVA